MMMATLPGVFNILKDNGQENTWVDQANVQPTFINILKSSLFSSFITTWHNSIDNSDINPIVRTCKRFKTDFRLETYLLEVKCRSDRISIARFRTSSHILRIETDRYKRPKPPVEDRTCIYCNNGQIDDESHFLLSCRSNSFERSIFFQSIAHEVDITQSINDLFISIMSNKTAHVMSKLGHYLKISFENRKDPIMRTRI